DGVLSAMAAESAPEGAVLAPILRKDRAEEPAALTALARLHTSGVDVDWTSAFAGTGACRVDLPTYAFQHERYWPEPAAGPEAGDDAFWDLVESGSLATELGIGAESAAELVPALSSWRSRRRARSTVDSWCYQETWTPLSGPFSTFDAGTWLVVVSEELAGDPWAASVAGALGPDAARLEISAAAQRDELAKRLAGHIGPAGVVALVDSVECTLLLQAMADAGIDARVWAVTRGAVSIGDGDAVRDASRASVWGLGRVAALELPARWGGLVDLPDELDERAIERFTGVLAAGVEDQVAVRPWGAFGRRMTPAPRSDAGPEPEPPSGTVLITGGTGALGAQLARDLVRRGADGLVLVSRSGRSGSGAAELRDELAAQGARVRIESCDAADRGALEALLAGIDDLSGVVHAAGVVDDGLLDRLTPERFDEVFRSKVDSARLLDELTRDRALDFFVLFSSVAGAIGNPGQANYAAANAVLDALAQQRRAEGLPATSIAWGAWAGTGAAADASIAERLRRRGVLPMEPELAMSALWRSVARGRTTSTVTNTDWETFAPSFTAVRASPLLSGIEAARRALEAQPSDGSGTALGQRLSGLSQEERGRVVLDVVRGEAAAVLGHPSPAAIGVDKAFRDLGFDSLTSLEMRDRLRKASGVPLPSALLFDYPTPRAVAEHLLANLTVDEAASIGSALSELDRFQAALRSSADEADDEAIRQRLEDILAGLREPAPSSEGDRPSEDDIKAMPVDELLNSIDNGLLDL
ncbi:beta-ketoacyl reductase, partial [Saccharopolyspora halophila]|uniref:beta-ketoacyl reductase n=1 Tax=Saccharopolyspora halophila TaxID=405551 RepID=UPI0031DFA5E7